MFEYEKSFIEFLYRCGALKFGDFTLKSGRKSPYFINTGAITSGRDLERLGYFFASAISQFMKSRADRSLDIVYGPPYKGITIAAATVISLAREFDIHAHLSTKRKETKDHGDRGDFLGIVPGKGMKAVIVDDVFTTGGTKEEAVAALQSLGAIPVLVLVSVLRREAGQDGKDAEKSFQEKYGIPVRGIVDVTMIMEYLRGREIDGKIALTEEHYSRMMEYISKYGSAREGVQEHERKTE